MLAIYVLALVMKYIELKSKEWNLGNKSEIKANLKYSPVPQRETLSADRLSYISYLDMTEVL